MDLDKTIGNVLIERGMLLIGDFTLSSGKKSPYYLDLKKFPSYPEFKDVVASALQVLKKVDYNYIVGVATGGVPLASFLACMSGMPMGYVRSEKKDYGTSRSVEGDVEGKRVVIVDDVATTGGSLVKAINSLRENRANVVASLVIVDRGEGGRETIEKLGVKFLSVFKIQDILRSLLNNKGIGQDKVRIIEGYLRGEV